MHTCQLHDTRHTLCWLPTTILCIGITNTSSISDKTLTQVKKGLESKPEERAVHSVDAGVDDIVSKRSEGRNMVRSWTLASSERR